MRAELHRKFAVDPIKRYEIKTLGEAFSGGHEWNDVDEHDAMNLPAGKNVYSEAGALTQMVIWLERNVYFSKISADAIPIRVKVWSQWRTEKHLDTNDIVRAAQHGEIVQSIFDVANQVNYIPRLNMNVVI